MSIPAPISTFESLENIPNLIHGFTLRVEGLDVKTDRETVLKRLDSYHRAAVERVGAGEMPVITATQVHGRRVEVVNEKTPVPVKGADGLVTMARGVCIGIYVADCCAIYAVDPVKGALGLAHSGRKGTELGIVTVLINTMQSAFGSDPADIVVQLSPCIRPPQYEVNFAATIIEHCHEAGVNSVSDCKENTGADLQRYYSYRMEKGRTGRMLAVIAWR
jgi:copper oxidase (laccase) domain-containing protein